MIDANIILQQQPMNLGLLSNAQVQQQALKLQDLAQQSEQNQLALQQERQAIADDASMRQAFAQNPNDPRAAISQAAATGNPLKAFALGKQIADTAKSQADTNAALLKAQQDKLTMIGNAAYSVLQAPPSQRAALYQQKRAQLIQAQAIDETHAPATYDEGWLTSAYQQAVGAKNTIDQKIREQQANATQARADAEAAGNKIRQQVADQNARTNTGMVDNAGHPVYFDKSQGKYASDPSVTVRPEATNTAQANENARFYQKQYLDAQAEEQDLYASNARIQAALDAGSYVDAKGNAKQPPQPARSELDAVSQPNEAYQKRLKSWQVATKADMQAQLQQNKKRAAQLVAIKNDASQKLGSTPQVSTAQAQAALLGNQPTPAAVGGKRKPLSQIFGK